MKKQFTINQKDIYNVDTTILFTSNCNFKEDLVELVNNDCEVIMRNMGIDINDIPLAILEEFDCLNLKNKEKLTKLEEIKIQIISSLISPKKTIVFFNILTFVNSDLKKKIIERLKEQGHQIINYTSEIEETLYLEYMVVLNKNQIIMEGLTKEVLKEEKILKKLGFNLPFIVELSSGLKYYNMVNKIYYDIESLVEDLWK